MKPLIGVLMHSNLTRVQTADLPVVSFQDLKEECVKLRTRVFDLEQQNRILSLLFQQRVKVSSAPVSQVTPHPACASETRLVLRFCSF